MENTYTFRKMGINRTVVLKLEDIMSWESEGFFVYLLTKDGKSYTVTTWQFEGDLSLKNYDYINNLSTSEKKEKLGIYYGTLGDRNRELDRLEKDMKKAGIFYSGEYHLKGICRNFFALREVFLKRGIEIKELWK